VGLEKASLRRGADLPERERRPGANACIGSPRRPRRSSSTTRRSAARRIFASFVTVASSSFGFFADGVDDGADFGHAASKVRKTAMAPVRRIDRMDGGL
jgi:hypothetical protein